MLFAISAPKKPLNDYTLKWTVEGFSQMHSYKCQPSHQNKVLVFSFLQTTVTFKVVRAIGTIIIILYSISYCIHINWPSCGEDVAFASAKPKTRVQDDVSTLVSMELLNTFPAFFMQQNQVNQNMIFSKP